MKIFLLIIILFVSGCEKQAEEEYSINIGADYQASFGVYSICGGGWTDKYGITWDSKGFNGDCFYEPRICTECCGSGTGEPPKEASEKTVNYYKTLVKQLSPKYTGICK